MHTESVVSATKLFMINALAVAFILVLFLPFASAAQTNPCNESPWWYKAKCIEKNAWLDQKLVEWKPEKYEPMKFNGHLLFSSEGLIDTTNSDMDSLFFDLINDLDTDTISLFIFPDMFEKHKARYETLISKIRSANKQLYVAYMVGNHADSPIYRTYSSFKEYKDTELAFTKMFVEKYRPDYYVIMDEPTTMEKRVELTATIDDWRALAIEAAAVVKNISPETKVVATGHARELAYIRSFAGISNIDLIGINLWGIEAMDETNPMGKNISDTMGYVKSKGKGLIFEQTWLTLMDAPEAQKLATYDFMKGLDVKYVRVLAYYANRKNASIYSPFYVGKFVSYSVDPQTFVTALNDKERTPVFYEYKNEISEVKSKTPQPLAVTNLSGDKVAVVYESISDGMEKRTPQDMAQILGAVNPDLVLRAWFIWDQLIVNTCDEYGYQQYVKLCNNKSASYAHIENASRELRNELPNVTIVGGLSARRLSQNAYDPIKRQWIYYPATWAMAFDPAKWGITKLSKKDVQCYYAMRQGWYYGNCMDYDPAKISGYFGDITNPGFQELFTDSAKRSIDAGADAIWIDLLWDQAVDLFLITGNESHPAVVESLESTKKIMGDIRNYGASKGRKVYVGSWGASNAIVFVPSFKPYLAGMDFVTYSPGPEEVRSIQMNETTWDATIRSMKAIHPQIPMFAFLDWGWGLIASPLATFSQELDPEQQKEFLKIADDFFQKKGIVFAYPVHGGSIKILNQSSKLAYGRYDVYDALAPEFDTYATIKGLALSKKGNSRYSSTFYARGIPSGTMWGITINGKRYTTTASSITVSGLTAAASYSYDSLVGSRSAGSRYVCNAGCSDSLNQMTGSAILAESTAIKAAYTLQYYLDMNTWPIGSSTLSPGSGWYDAGSSVSIYASPNSKYRFYLWSGSGAGKYTGTNNPATVTINGSIKETASFSRCGWLLGCYLFFQLP